MTSYITAFLSKTVSLLWGPATVLVFLALGLYFTAGIGGIQLLRPDLWLLRPLKILFSKGGSPAKAGICTVLAATVGTGNVVGVAAALASGGAGAVLWMWVSAFAGMALGYAENVLGALYRPFQKGNSAGGAYLYIKHGLCSPALAGVFCTCCALAAFGIGNLTQCNAMAQGIFCAASNMGIPFGKTGFFILGILTLGAAAPAVLRGKKTVAKITSRLVPVMVVAYTVGAGIIIAANYQKIIPAFSLIFRSAFNIKSGIAGITGFCISSAVKTGLARGLFSHEAGMGSSVAAHAAVKDNTPCQVGLMSMFEVFCDTVFICTLTALALITSGAYGKGDSNSVFMVCRAFSSVMGDFGNFFVAASLAVFAFSTLLGWEYIGEDAFSALTGGKTFAYRVFYTLVIPLGFITQVNLCWLLSDLLNWFMAIPNLLAITLLSGRVFNERKNEKWDKKG